MEGGGGQTGYKKQQVKVQAMHLSLFFFSKIWNALKIILRTTCVNEHGTI